MACSTSGSAHASSNGSDCPPAEYSRIAGFTPVEDAATVELFLDKAGVPQEKRPYPRGVLYGHRIIWWKDSPGDCGTQTSIGITVAQRGTQVAGIASAGAGAVGALAGGASAAAAGSTLAGTALLASGIGAIAGIALLPFAFISAHHAQALALERATLCDVAVSYNQWADAVEKGLRSGAIPLSDAQTGADDVLSALTPHLDAIAKPCNSACLIKYALQALTILNKEKVFPSLIPRPSVQGDAAGAASKGTAQPNATAPKGATALIGVVALGAAALAAKLMFA